MPGDEKRVCEMLLLRFERRSSQPLPETERPPTPCFIDNCFRAMSLFLQGKIDRRRAETRLRIARRIDERFYARHQVERWDPLEAPFTEDPFAEEHRRVRSRTIRRDTDRGPVRMTVPAPIYSLRPIGLEQRRYMAEREQAKTEFQARETALEGLATMAKSSPPAAPASPDAKENCAPGGRKDQAPEAPEIDPFSGLETPRPPGDQTPGP